MLKKFKDKAANVSLTFINRSKMKKKINSDLQSFQTLSEPRRFVPMPIRTLTFFDHG